MNVKDRILTEQVKGCDSFKKHKVSMEKCLRTIKADFATKYPKASLTHGQKICDTFRKPLPTFQIEPLSEDARNDTSTQLSLN